MTISFGAPIGGVLFSVELNSYMFNIENLWRALYSASISLLIFKLTHSNDIVNLFSIKAHDFYQEDDRIFEYN
jgi:chloride channel 2